MPLQGGPSRKAFKENLKKLRSEGKGKIQSLAIALKKAGKARKKSKDRDSRKNLISVLSPRG